MKRDVSELAIFDIDGPVTDPSSPRIEYAEILDRTADNGWWPGSYAVVGALPVETGELWKSLSMASAPAVRTGRNSRL